MSSSSSPLKALALRSTSEGVVRVSRTCSDDGQTYLPSRKAVSSADDAIVIDDSEEDDGNEDVQSGVRPENQRKTSARLNNFGNGQPWTEAEDELMLLRIIETGEHHLDWNSLLGELNAKRSTSYHRLVEEALGANVTQARLSPAGPKHSQHAEPQQDQEYSKQRRKYADQEDQASTSTIDYRSELNVVRRTSVKDSMEYMDCVGQCPSQCGPYE